jgi:hypothetical protein
LLLQGFASPDPRSDEELRRVAFKRNDPQPIVEMMLFCFNVFKNWHMFMGSWCELGTVMDSGVAGVARESGGGGGVSPKLFLNLLDRTDSMLALPRVNSVMEHGRFVLTRSVQRAFQQIGYWERCHGDDVYEVADYHDFLKADDDDVAFEQDKREPDDVFPHVRVRNEVFSLARYHRQRFGEQRSQFDAVGMNNLLKVFTGLAVERAGASGASGGGGIKRSRSEMEMV